MHKEEFQESVTKGLVLAVSRMLWNKNKTVKSYSVQVEPKKHIVKVEFALAPPFSPESSIFIIVRDNGLIERWVQISENQERKKEEFPFADSSLAELKQEDIRHIVHQLLKEIGS